MIDDVYCIGPRRYRRQDCTPAPETPWLQPAPLGAKAYPWVFGGWLIAFLAGYRHPDALWWLLSLLGCLLIVVGILITVARHTRLCPDCGTEIEHGFARCRGCGLVGERWL